jgi:ABC-type sugar transport system ATPase subunit
VRSGEVHAVCGENGAGKSTLMRLLAGIYRPDSGSIELDVVGKVRIADERHAQQLGIAIVYQERSLFDLLTLSENLFVNKQPLGLLGCIDRKALRAEAQALLAEVNLDFDPDAVAGQLSPAEQQMLEIAKALSIDSRVFILDEPTAALTLAETETLFALIRKMKKRGVGIVYISHRLEEIFRIADRVSVLKDGVMQGTWNMREVTAEQLVTRMVGRESLHEHVQRTLPVRATPKLAVRRMCDGKLKDVTFEAHAGEILGFAGLAGAGRTELALAVFGARSFDRGEVLINGERVKIASPADAMTAGIGYMPEERKEQGMFLEMNIGENIAAARLDAFGGWLVKNDSIFSTTTAFMQRFGIAAAGPKTLVGKLSGGNQQKVLLSRWLLRDPAILIVDEPTRGIDVGAKAQIHAALRGLADRGKAIIVISSDLPEILAISDRIIVMRQGAIAAEMPVDQATEESIIRYASIGQDSQI